MNGEKLRLANLSEGGAERAKAKLAKSLPSHYTSPKRIARVFENLGKPGVANLLRTKLPTNTIMRSGDLGEIMAAEYVQECTNFQTPVKRLRWKDHREMPLRGEDVIGVYLSDDATIRFLKVEAKSAVTLKTGTVEKARNALNQDHGLPSSHALTFMSDRLIELGEPKLADAIDRALLGDGIARWQVCQMIFTFSGNAPDAFLRADLECYEGKINQLSVGVRIESHQDFIAKVYDTVLAVNES